MRARVPAAVLMGAAGLVAVHARGPQEPTQTFRTGTDVVFVDVSVREGGKPVAGLRAEDFVLTDNGVRQRVESVEAAAVPIDLTLVVDVSGNPSGPWQAPTPVESVLGAIQKELADVTALLRPDDRLRMLAIGRGVQLLIPFSPPGDLPPVRLSEFEGLAALFDTVAAALLHPVAPARRHVVIVRTKGVDTISALDAAALQGIAERSEALLHIVLMERALDADTALKAFQCIAMGLCHPTRRFWVPFQRRLIGSLPDHRVMLDGQAVAAGAEATGGGLHKSATLREPTLTGTFRRAFEDFRSSYVLRYTPTGVPRAGWHSIDVRVPGSRRYAIRARKGYGVDAEAPATSAAKPASLDTLAGLVGAYGEGRYRDVVTALRTAKEPDRLLREFDEGGNPWPADPRREAAFALELAEPPVFSRTADERERVYDMLGRFSRLIRHPFEPDTFELRWHFAAVTLLEGTLRPAEAEAFVTRAIARFPEEPRFLLSRAILADQRTVRSQERGPAVAGDTGSIEELFLAAVQHPATAPEARVRLGFWLHRNGRSQEALAHLDETAPSDPTLSYLRELFRGHALATLDRLDEATDAYRRALEIAPTAQSARVALMNTLLLLGIREDAEALAEQVQTERTDELDPWWTYWQGQYRFQPAAMAGVREMVER